MRKRKRSSRYDAFHDLIAKWCSQGVPVSKMTEELSEKTGEVFYDQGIYAYIKRHNLRRGYWKDVYEARNQCDDCEFCKKYINTNNTEGRICTKSWKTIQPNVVCSPRWCEK